MINNLFTAIQNRLMAGDPLGLAHCGWYRRQERDADKAQPYNCPAVLIEVPPIQWETMSSRVQIAAAEIVVHVVQDKYTDTQGHLALPLRVKTRLIGLSAAGTIDGVAHTFLNSMHCIREQVDHGQTNRDVHTLTFLATVYDYGAVIRYQNESPAPEVQGEVVEPG